MPEETGVKLSAPIWLCQKGTGILSCVSLANTPATWQQPGIGNGGALRVPRVCTADQLR